MIPPLWRLDAFTQAQYLQAGTLTAVELLRHYQARIAAMNPLLNAIICDNPEAEAQARASDARHARACPLSLIDGLPILVKDNLMVAGMPTTWGCPYYAQRATVADELPIEKLRQAGAVFIGKSNVPEFTLEAYTDNPLFGATGNPWNTDLTPGGSSGGSVAAVAAGLAPLAVGTDGGGSIRRPAAYTNLIGLKPSIGRVPRHGGLPQLLLDMEVVGPITRTVRDQAMLFDVLATPDSRDCRSLRLAAGTGLKSLDKPLAPLRILAVERFGDAPLDPQIADCFFAVANRFSDLGHQLQFGELPLDIESVNQRWSMISASALAKLMTDEPRMSKFVSARYVDWAAEAPSAADLLAVSESIQQLRHEAAAVFESVDLIITPTCAAMPWSRQLDFPPTIDGQPVGPRGSAVYTGWVNACGHPAISLPAGFSRQNLPIGVQLVGGFGKDELLIQIAAQLEQQMRWADYWPSLVLDAAPGALTNRR